jgi:putative ABC transport system permease protein
MAMGAQPGDIFRLVLRQGMTITLIGIGIGRMSSAAISRLMTNVLYGVSPTDAVTYTGAALLWLVVSLAACYLPACRAAKIEPLAALRYE